MCTIPLKLFVSVILVKISAMHGDTDTNSFNGYKRQSHLLQETVEEGTIFGYAGLQ